MSTIKQSGDAVSAQTEALIGEITKDRGDPQTHCPFRQAALLRQALAPDKGRFGFLLGAGCSVSIRIPDGEKSRPLIPDIAGLTLRIRTALESDDKYKETHKAVLERLENCGISNPNIEEVLTHIRTWSEIIGKGTVGDLSKKTLADLEKRICEITTEVVRVRLPSSDSPYHSLASWIASIPRSHAVEIFTTNYDLLMEQALEDRRVPYFDGFTGSDRTFFDVASMEHDVLPSRWARLWKIHGSINWWRSANGGVQRRERGEDADLQMIHPSHLKYDQSRRMPYLAMLDRFRNFLAQDQSILITCGYSFADQHINDVIVEGLNGNPTAICFGLLYGDRGKASDAVHRASRNGNLKILAVDGGVIGTLNRDWRSTGEERPGLSGAVSRGVFSGRTTSSDDRFKFLLGDFKSFGTFLAEQLAQRGEEEVESDAT